MFLSNSLGSRLGEEWSLEKVEVLPWNLLPLEQGSFPTYIFFSDHNHRYAEVHSPLGDYHSLRHFTGAPPYFQPLWRAFSWASDFSPDHIALLETGAANKDICGAYHEELAGNEPDQVLETVCHHHIVAITILGSRKLFGFPYIVP